DPAEMLVCLARDWTDGSVALRWWWRSLLRTTDPGRALLQTWLEAIEHAPAALQRLAEPGNAVPFIRALTSSQARTLLESIAQKFGLAVLLEIIESAPSDSSGKGDQQILSMDESTVKEVHGAATQNRTALPPSWLPWVADLENEDLTREGLLLV